LQIYHYPVKWTENQVYFSKLLLSQLRLSIIWLILSITNDRLAILLPAILNIKQRASLFNIVRFKFSQSGFNAIGFLFIFIYSF
jgi:hypothetical protein